MRTTTKFLTAALILITVFSTVEVKAQATDQMMDPAPMMNSDMGWRLGFGLNGGLFKKSSAMDYAYGADIRLQYDLARAISLTATAGYTRLMYASDLLPDVDFIPVKGGVKIFAIHRMYLSGELGAGFGIKDGAKTNLIYSGGLGYAFMKGLDVGARYEGYVNDISSSTYFMKTGQFALRIAYGFKI